MADHISIENVKLASEEHRADRRRFLKYAAGAAVVVAAAAAGYYALTPPPAPSPQTRAATTPTTSVPPPVATSTTEIHTGLTVTSEAFANGERLPPKYTCDGQGISPPVNWSGAPQETRTYALILDDLNAPGGIFTHWVIFNIPAQESGLQEDVPSVPTLPNGAIQGRNSAGKIGYVAPCPPSGTHHYVFHLYALDLVLDLQPGAAKQDVLKAMQGHIMAEGQLTGLYGKG